MGWEDDEPTMGVREPRRPLPSSLSGGAAVEPPLDAYAEAEAIAESPRVVISTAHLSATGSAEAS